MIYVITYGGDYTVSEGAIERLYHLSETAQRLWTGAIPREYINWIA
jgi:hypothetical protein